MRRTALVTGGNRGIGLAICRQFARQGMEVVLTSRDPADGEQAAATLRGEGLGVRTAPLDLDDPESVRRCAEQVAVVDVLVNNAAILVDSGVSLFDVDEALVRQTMETNFYGPLRTCRAWVPGMRARGYGRVVNVSSAMGSLAMMEPGTAAYSISKTALNALTRMLALEAGPRVKVNAMSPGWVQTPMGYLSGNPTRTPDEGADTAVWLATLPDDGPSGGFFRDRAPLPW